MSLDNTSTTKVEQVVSFSNQSTYQNMESLVQKLLIQPRDTSMAQTYNVWEEKEELWFSTKYMQ